MKDKRILLIALGALIALFFFFDLGQYLNLDYLKSKQAALDSFYQTRPLFTIAVFFIVYVAVAALSLPGAAIMTLAGGAIFGLAIGTLVVSFASTIGATLAFLASRYIFRDIIVQKFGDKLETINANIDKDGAFYLFTVRLIPILPFFIVNLVMGLTRLPLGIFYIVSQIGMLAGTLVFVNAGTQLAKIDSLSGILSPGLLFSFVLLGAFPLIAKKSIELFKGKKHVH